MSKHWDPRESGGTGQWDRRPRPRRRSPRRRWWNISASEASLVVLAGLFLGLWSAGLPQGAARSAQPETEPQVARAIRVIDGDTFDYGGERIRIADIDTPELRARCAEEAVLARRATDRLDTLLRQGPFELRRLGRDEDRYGRKLRVVMRRGRSIGDTLVAEGLARTWTGRREPWC